MCLANVISRLSSIYAIAVRPTQSVEIFGNVSSPFGTLAIRWHSVKILRTSSQGIPSMGGGLNAKGVAKYSDFGDLGGHILQTVQDRGKLVLITNRKLYMSFRLVPKSLTLNDLERLNGLYFALFYRIFRGALHKNSCQSHNSGQFTITMSSSKRLQRDRATPPV